MWIWCEDQKLVEGCVGSASILAFFRVAGLDCGLRGVLDLISFAGSRLRVGLVWYARSRFMYLEVI